MPLCTWERHLFLPWQNFVGPTVFQLHWVWLSTQKWGAFLNGKRYTCHLLHATLYVKKASFITLTKFCRTYRFPATQSGAYNTKVRRIPQWQNLHNYIFVCTIFIDISSIYGHKCDVNVVLSMLSHFLRDVIVQKGSRARGLKEKELQFDFYIKICSKMINS